MSSNPAHVDANPGVRAGETALRLGLGELTIDLLEITDSAAVDAAVSIGQLGKGPTTGQLEPRTVALLVAAADFRRSVRPIQTAAWPLA